jgi:energy coupling factor transporter S component ThiW
MLDKNRSKMIALAALFIAIGVVISPFTWFPVGPSKANPTQHVVNVLSGILLGPLWGAFIAFAIGLIRNILGVGTIFAFPGGIPGALIVGFLFHYIFKRLFSYNKAILAAFAEPIGTVLIGATISIYILIPAILSNITALMIFYLGWLASSVIGSIIGFLLLRYLSRVGYDRKRIVGED